MNKLVAETFKRVHSKRDIFSELSGHVVNVSNSFGSNHIYQLIRKTARCFANLRFYHYGKTYSVRVAQKNVASRRHELTKLVLFLHRGGGHTFVTRSTCHK